MTIESEVQRAAKRRKSTMIKALLAGGLVLGVGAAVTLATWNDSEFAQGTFQSGTFNVESSTDGLTFSDHPSTDPAELSISLGGAKQAIARPNSLVIEPAASRKSPNLTPGDSVAAPFALRVAAGSQDGAQVSVVADPSTGSLDGLSYELFQTTDFGCDSESEGDLVAAGTQLGTLPIPTTVNLDAPADASDPGDAVNLCFVVTAGSDLPQGQTGTATWEFDAESQTSGPGL